MILEDIAKRTNHRAILLDIDGTLVDTNGTHAESWSLACAEFGYDRPASFFRPLMGMGGDFVLPKIDASLDNETSPGREIAKRNGEIFKERFLSSARPTRGARALIERLKSDGWQCVMATSAQPDELAALLDVVGIADAIDERADSSDASQSKPAPDIVAAALAKAGVPAGDAVLLGDSPYDVTSARHAGIATIALRCGGFSDAELANAAEIFDDPRDLLERLTT